MTTGLQDTSPEAVALWLKQLDHTQLRDQAWLHITERFPGFSKGIAPYLLEHYSDPKERQAAFDGLTLALLVLSHYQDVKRLSKLFTLEAGDENATQLITGGESEDA